MEFGVFLGRALINLLRLIFYRARFFYMIYTILKKGGFKLLAQWGRQEKNVIWGLEVEAFTSSSVVLALLPAS